MELTREDSIRIAIELWTWLAKTGREKHEWPGWEEYGEMELDCPFCEYGAQQGHLGLVEDECVDACPYCQKFGGCCNVGSPYDYWCRVSTERESKKYAAQFLKQLKRL